MPLTLESGQSLVCLNGGTEIVVYNSRGGFVGKLDVPQGLSVNDGSLMRFIVAEARKYNLTATQRGDHAFDLK